MKRRSFLKNAAWSTCALSTIPVTLYGLTSSDHPWEKEPINVKISLAQWSLHRQIYDGNLNPDDFASIAIDTYGLDAVEYVNGFYRDSGEDEKFWIQMKERADKAGVKSLLIMVDDEGDLGIANDNKRKKAVENHYKWVNAAKILECHSIRVNAFGESEKVAGMGKGKRKANSSQPTI